MSRRCSVRLLKATERACPLQTLAVDRWQLKRSIIQSEWIPTLKGKHHDSLLSPCKGRSLTSGKLRQMAITLSHLQSAGKKGGETEPKPAVSWSQWLLPVHLPFTSGAQTWSGCSSELLDLGPASCRICLRVPLRTQAETSLQRGCFQFTDWHCRSISSLECLVSFLLRTRLAFSWYVQI